MGSVTELCRHLFGADTKIDTDTQSVSVAAGASGQVLPNNPDRVAMILCAPFNLAITAWPFPDVSATTGLCFKQQNRLLLTARDHGQLVTSAWYVYNGAGTAQNIAVISVVTIKPVKSIPAEG